MQYLMQQVKKTSTQSFSEVQKVLTQVTRLIKYLDYDEQIAYLKDLENFTNKLEQSDKKAVLTNYCYHQLLKIQSKHAEKLFKERSAKTRLALNNDKKRLSKTNKSKIEEADRFEFTNDFTNQIILNEKVIGIKLA